MNILALDCAVTRISLAVKTDSKFISATYDIGMRQSEILVPSIDELLKKAELNPSELNATALTIGPGSFTGLRLGAASLSSSSVIDSYFILNSSYDIDKILVTGLLYS